MMRVEQTCRSRARHNVHEWGTGAETLVFGHGLGTNHRCWWAVAEQLATERHVVLLDWVGSGNADPRAFDAARYSSLHGHASDLCELLQELGRDRVTYVGHSAGGMIGVLAAIRAPKLFQRLVLLSASPRYIDEAPGYGGGFSEADVEAVLNLMRENFLGWSSTFATVAAGETSVAAELEATFRERDPGHLREFAEAVLRSDFRAELPRLEVPALVLASARDDMVPVGVSEYLHRHLRGSSYRCFEVAGHCPQLTHPTIVADAIRAYLAEASATCDSR